MIRLGILGCGAIAEKQYLPASARLAGIRVTALVDINPARTHLLRETYGLDCQVTTDYREAFRNVDAVVNALPNNLHAAANLAAIDAGIHVLCEKPLATTLEDARRCCEEAERKRVVFAMSMPRRFYASAELMRLVLRDGTLGTLREYDWEHGVPFAWDTASGFYFSRPQAGGGVTLDEGVHLLDCLLNWFGPATLVSYQDDNWGSGIEANAVLHVQHDGDFGRVSGRVRLSRTYNLKNRLFLTGGRAELELRRSEPNSVLVRRVLGGQRVSMRLQLEERGEDDDTSGRAFRALLADFLRAVQGGSTPAVEARDGLDVLRLIDAAYRKAERISEPWLERTRLPPGGFA